MYGTIIEFYLKKDNSYEPAKSAPQKNSSTNLAKSYAPNIAQHPLAGLFPAYRTDLHRLGAPLHPLPPKQVVLAFSEHLLYIYPAEAKKETGLLSPFLIRALIAPKTGVGSFLQKY